jgi:hypothetical protein
MPDVGGEDVEEVVRRLDAQPSPIAPRRTTRTRARRTGAGRRISWKTAQNVWGDLTHAFDEARHSKDKSLRVLERDPTEDLRGPERGLERSKPILSPTRS